MTHTAFQFILCAFFSHVAQTIQLASLAQLRVQDYGRSNASVVFDPEMTLGFEQEWGGRHRFEASEELPDHTNIFVTNDVVFSFELQGQKTTSTIGQVEAISSPFLLGKDLPRLVKALTQVDAVDSLIKEDLSSHADRDFRKLVKQDPYLKDQAVTEKPEHGGTPLHSFARWKSYDWIKSISRTSEESLRNMPQVTVSYPLSYVHTLFSLGFPFESPMMSPMANPSLHDHVMKDVVTGAKSFTAALGWSGVPSDPESQKVLGFFVLLTQELYVLGMYGEKAHTYTSYSGRKFTIHPKAWVKDWYGLLSKTPLPAVFRALASDSRKLIQNNRKALEKVSCNILKDSWDAAEPKHSLRKLHSHPQYVNPLTFCIEFNDCKPPRHSSRIYLLKDYLDLLFDPSSPLAYTSAVEAKATNAWTSLIMDKTSTPIIYPKPDRDSRLISPALRVAFEYRQLKTGTLRTAIRDITGLTHEQLPDRQ